MPPVLTRPIRERLDQRLRREQPALSWARLRAAIEKGQVTVNGAEQRDPAAPVAPRDVVVFDVNRKAVRAARSRFDRLYEDEHVLVLDKPAGLLTVPAHREGAPDEDTVLARVREYMERRRGTRGYVGPLHRLDRDTSGALAVALSREAHEAGRELFSAHGFDRQYLALVHGAPADDTGTIDAPIADAYVAGRRRLAIAGEPARDAVTHFVVRERFGDGGGAARAHARDRAPASDPAAPAAHGTSGARRPGLRTRRAGRRRRGRCSTPGGWRSRTRSPARASPSRRRCPTIS